MKKLLFALLIFTGQMCFAQDTSKKSETPVLDKTEQMIDKYGGKIADVFSSAMETAKPAAKEGFRALVMLQITKER